MTVKPSAPPKAEEDLRIFRDVRKFLEVANAAGGTPLDQLSPPEARQSLVDAQAAVKVDYSGIEESQRQITGDGYTIDIHIVKPQGGKAGLPVFLFFHGGGWVLGDYPTHRRMVRDLVVESGLTAVFPDYSRSPEAQYPVAINQAYAATRWVAEHGQEIGVDGKKLAVVGNSAGGNMAAVVSLMAKNKQGPGIKLQVLCWPVTNADFDTDSYLEYAEGRFNTRKMMIYFWDSYTRNEAERRHIYASPLMATFEQLKGLPPALVLTAENDVLRDEGEAYARKLEEAGVKVAATRYLGLIHDWGLLNALATLPSVRASLSQIATELKKALL